MTGKYSIWFVPKGEVYERLSKLISALSESYSLPKFEPHLSLMIDILDTEEEMLSKTALLASSIQSFPIKLSEIAYEEDFRKCLFIKVEPSDELIQANLKARDFFSRQSDPPFMPHLSLMYGKFPKETKEEIILKVGKSLDLSFGAQALFLYTSGGGPTQWQKIKEFPFRI